MNFNTIRLAVLCLIVGLSSPLFSQISVSTTWVAGWGPGQVGTDTAGLDTAALPLVPQRFGASQLVDLNGDGLTDFVSGSNRGIFFFFENVGTTNSPVWVRTQGVIPTLDSIDIGYLQNTNEVRPHFADIDNDNDMDLFVGSRWNYPGLHKLDDLHFFRNIGSATNPIFTRDTIPGLQFQQVGEFAGLGFGDLDNDGDLDFVAGGSDSCTYFENIGTATNPVFDRNDIFPNASWVEISFLAPTPDLEDFDGDGDLDLYFMNEAGFIRYIPNNGSASSPDFSPYVSYPAHSFDTVDFGAFGAMSFEDVNGDGVKDLLASHWNPTTWYWYKGIPDGPTISMSSSNITCNGANDGYATVSVSSGYPPYQYMWSTNDTIDSIGGLSAGTYSVTLTDSTGDSATASVIITEPTTLVSSGVVDSNVTCHSYANGGASSSASGGTTPYSYLWSNSATTASITGVVAGTYSVTITDANGCTDSSSVAITQPTALMASTALDSNASCSTCADGGATASASGGTGAYSYSWSNSATTASITGVVSGTYSVTISDANGCTDSASIFIDDIPPVTITVNNDSNVTCNGLSDGGASVTITSGTSPYSYEWSTSSTATYITGLTAGTYSVTVTDANSLTSSGTVIITQPNELVTATAVDSNISCNGLSDGGATASATGGTTSYAYAWSNSATTASITGVISGTYSVTITDVNGCTDSSSVTVTQPSVLNSSTSLDSNVSCNGFSNGGASASGTGGTTAYMYAWSNSATTASITGVVAGTYSVTVTDANGCTDSSSIAVTQPTELISSASVTANVSCNGLADGSATASGSGGTTSYSYLWSNAAATASITGTAAGTYSVTVTDANGCTDSSSVSITQPTALVSDATVTANASCNGLADGGASASASGGTTAYSYLWSNASSSSTVTGLSAGTYNVTITDANGCTDSSSVTITEPDSLIASITLDSNVSCHGFSNGGALASAVGGTGSYDYAWSNASTMASISGVVADTYAITITDANGCMDSSSIVITQPDSLIASASVDANISCNGMMDGMASAMVSGGTAGYTYLWSNADTSASVSGLAAGSYSVFVIDANGCMDSASLVISEPDSLMLSASVDADVSCNGLMDGSASTSVMGGTMPYSYLWSNASTSSSLTGVGAGSYNVVVTDSNGCMDSASVMITEPDSLFAHIDSVMNVVCFGDSNGMAYGSATGGTVSYNYSWSNGDVTSTASGLTLGAVSVTVTDANGCTSVTTDSIDYDFELPVVDLGPDVTVTDSAVVVSPSGDFVSYLWSDSTSDSSITVTTNGTVWLIATDSNGCMNSDTINISLWPTGVETVDNSIQLNVYPNPTHGELTIETAGFGTDRIDWVLYSVDGRKATSGKLNRNRSTQRRSINLQGIASGPYMLQVSSGTDSKTVLVVIE